MLNWTWAYNILYGDGRQFRNDSLYYDGHGEQTGRFDERFPSTSQNPFPIPIKSPPVAQQPMILVSSWQPQLLTPIERWELIPY